MIRPMEDVSDRILTCARQEFMEKGFSEASLRRIASMAESTTGSIYSRFGGKEGLYSAIVEPVARHLMVMFEEIQEQFHQMEAQTQEESLEEYTTSGMEKMLDYMYDHFEEFQLLLDASYGTKFQDFVERMVELETEYTGKYMDAVKIPTSSGIVTSEFVHIMNKALFESYFEVIRHKMPKEKAVRYVRMLEKYHYAGWNAVFSLAQDDSL